MLNKTNLSVFLGNLISQDILENAPIMYGNRFKDVDLTNKAKQPIKSTYASKQRKKSKRNR